MTSVEARAGAQLEPSPTGEESADQPLPVDLGAVFGLAWPNILGNAVHTVVGWYILRQVGLLGTVEIAAYGLGRTIVMWAGAAFWALNAGVMVLVARHVGRRESIEAGRSMLQGAYLALSLTIPTALAGALLAPGLLSWLGGEAEVVARGTAFLRIYMVSMIFMVIWFLATSTLRAAGRTRSAMYLEWFGNGLQGILTYLLVVGPGILPAMGLVGAAYALLISRMVSFLAALTVIRVSGVVGFPTLSWGGWGPDWSTMQRIGKLSLPASIEGVARQSGVLALLTLVTTSDGGTAAVSGYTIGIQLEPIINTTGTALGVAATAVVGQNLATHFHEAAEQGAWNAVRLTFYILVALAVLALAFPQAVVGLFSSDPAVIHFGAGYVRALGDCSRTSVRRVRRMVGPGQGRGSAAYSCGMWRVL